MDYFKKETDDRINKKIKKFGVKRVAETAGVSFAYIYRLLNNVNTANPTKYSEIKKAVKFLSKRK